MQESSQQYVAQDQVKLFYAFAFLVLVFSGYALFTENYLLAFAPLIIPALLVFVKDYSLLYYSFWMLLPFSIEFSIGSFGTDLPTEPIMLGLTGIGILLFAAHGKNMSLKYLIHPISLFLVLHLVWIVFTTIFSQSPIVSFKFFLAKVWYVVPFYFLTFHFYKNVNSIEKFAKVLTIFLGIAITIVLTRHALEGFTFESSHEVVRPIFRNHVNYSAIIVAALPFVWAFTVNTEKGNTKNILIGVMLLFVLGTYFSYTRAAQLCLFIALGAYIIFKYRVGKLALGGSLILAILAIFYLSNKNKYLEYAPNFEKTVAHTKFDNLLEATYKMEDISTMERVYRWVAAKQMVEDRPWVGFGPGSFYFHYKKYVLRSFETYVSDNPEKSGIHNYYFMTLVEQGIFGLIILIGFIFFTIIYGEGVYHSLQNKKEKNYVMAATISTVVIAALLIINDLIEADKVGPFFFLNASLIVLHDIRLKEATKSTSRIQSE